MLGDTPTSPLVSLVLFKVLISKEDPARSLNLARSATAFSKETTLDRQDSHMWEEKWSSRTGSGTSRSSLILPAHLCLIPLLLNKATAFLGVSTVLHNRHTLVLSAITHTHQKITTVIEHVFCVTCLLIIANAVRVIFVTKCHYVTINMRSR